MTAAARAPAPPLYLASLLAAISGAPRSRVWAFLFGKNMQQSPSPTYLCHHAGMHQTTERREPAALASTVKHTGSPHSGAVNLSAQIAAVAAASTLGLDKAVTPNRILSSLSSARSLSIPSLSNCAGFSLPRRQPRPRPRPSWAAAGSTRPLRVLGSRSRPCPK